MIFLYHPKARNLVDEISVNLVYEISVVDEISDSQILGHLLTARTCSTAVLKKANGVARLQDFYSNFCIIYLS